MTPTPPLSDHLWNSASPELQAAILALVQNYQEQLATLDCRLRDLEARLKRVRSQKAVMQRHV